MFLEKLSLINYKNFEVKNLDFNPKINCITGLNGVGKTNILDAIYHLAFTKGYFNNISTQNIQHGKDFFLIEGVFNFKDRLEVVSCGVKTGQKKIVKRNGKEYDKLSDHIGLIPVVIISPNDTDLIATGSEVRRKFIDGIIAQSNKKYLQYLLQYNKALAQRNALLKYFASNHIFDAVNLEIYNEQLVEYGTYIYQQRIEFVAAFKPLFKERYKQISKYEENVSFIYKSRLHETEFKPLLQNNLKKDRILQYTSVGIHKDDLLYTIAGYPIKKYGSQGQQKTYLIALKLAEFDIIKSELHTTPLLLLDDIFDKLDEKRVKEIVNLVNDRYFGQIFLTDTHTDRTEKVIQQTAQPYTMINIT
ncbi:MAG: DNA replication and repair protein RecF [Flavobacteriales bacterium]|nr:MAG: DNA replication and repair protein RecF [Flavobacteriales bacterium]